MLSILIAFSATAFPVRTRAETAFVEKEEKLVFGYDRVNTYDSYLERYKDMPRPSLDMLIKGCDYSASEDAALEKAEFLDGAGDILKWNNPSGTVEWSVNIPAEGLYRMDMKYYPLESANREMETALYINGEIPFSSAQKFVFSKAWQDGREIKRDSRGNDVRPDQKEKPMWLTNSFKDIEGLYNEPFAFYLKKGVNKIALKASRACFAIDSIRIYNEDGLKTYKEISSGYIQKGYKPADQAAVKIQGEKPFIKSDSTLQPMYDRSSPATEPADPTKMRYNTIGQLNWQYKGQWISWKFEVPEDGLYKVGMRARQNYVRGNFTSRNIYIDGKMPFQEMEGVKFNFDSKWYIKMLGDTEPFLFYLTRGEHEIAMEVVPGDMARTIRLLEDVVYKLNYLYRKILMITGTKPDMYRDYYLEKEIPGLMEDFAQLKDTMLQEKARIENMTGARGSDAITLQILAAQLESFIKDPDTIPVRLENYISNVSSLSAWMLKLKQQPLEIDYIEILSPDKSFRDAEGNIIERLLFGIRSFIGSFREDYNSIGNTYDKKEALNVWVGMGRDQTQLIKEMVDDYFTPETGIKVNVSLVEQGLVQATLAGRGPDVALFIPHGEPVNLAVRGALTDLSDFEGFAAVRKRFIAQAMVPYEYNGGYYGLPVTQTFSMMFYRKDIFEELGIKAPETWDDFYNAVPVIQRNHMSVGIPNMTLDHTGAGAANNGIFDTLLFQRGGRYYNDRFSKTELDTPEALEAFQQWTDFYAHYSFPLSYDFYNRFRTGEMPLAVDSYTMYNKLKVAAPEIRDLWEVTPIPGIKKSNGVIDRSVSGGGQSCVIFKKAKDKEAAWSFIKWFTAADMQAQFGRSLEALMGPAARYDTANTEAFGRLPWSKEEYEKLTAQWKYVKEVPQIPASYYVYRNLYNAFRRVLFNNTNQREALFIYNREMNKEINRKRAEFGLENGLGEVKGGHGN